MPLFQGHKDSGIQRLFIELPDDQKELIAWKWPDQQIIQHSLVNVDLDYLAVFTNLGKVIGTLGPGRHPLDEGASLTLGWLVDRLTGDAYYDAELYFVTTRDIANQEFGGPVDRRVAGEALADRFDARICDMQGCVEIRLAGGQSNDVLTFGLEFGGPSRHRESRGGLNLLNTLGNGEGQGEIPMLNAAQSVYEKRPGGARQLARGAGMTYVLRKRGRVHCAKRANASKGGNVREYAQ